MTEPIDQATKDLIEKEANDLLLKYPADRALSEGRKKWYIAGATVWAEKLKQERNKAIDECIYILETETGDTNLIPLLESLKTP